MGVGGKLRLLNSCSKHKHYLLQNLFMNVRCVSSEANPSQQSFPVSYLINKCGFSPGSALSASKRLTFESPDQPDAVIHMFKRYGFSDADIFRLIKETPTSRSLENHITPNFNLLSDLLTSDNKVIAAARNDPFILFRHGDRYLKPFITLLQDHGVPRTQIASLICNWPRSIGVCLNHFRKCVEKVREMGYDPYSAEFTRSVVVLSQLGKGGWERKSAVYKSWGWSEKDILVAFRKNPWSLMTSENKIMAVMKFFVEKMDCESLYIAEHPNLLMYSLEKRLIPRALVLHFLLRNKLIAKKPNLNTLFVYSEKLFLEKFVNCFDEAPHLLKLYRDQSDPAK
ncbi:CGI-12 PROTEIN-RELATED [Salix viminalis]|uniref:CGI-12 PROTEIN-RELATED n=1 Tax=Salix viminalis TaxID=40686 RepID=A0A9Q0NMS3_SALVM|nr:CGI-12 PROTEIN-RELATED [Salix viminalis]